MNMDPMIRNPAWGTGGTGIPPGILNDEARHASSRKLALKTAKGMVTIEHLFQILIFVKRI